MLLYVHLCNVDKIKYKTIEKDFYERFYSCNEIIVQNKNGIIVPPQDEHALYKAMKYFLDNPNEVKRMAKNARAMITSRYERNKFWKLMLEEYYRQIKNRIK